MKIKPIWTFVLGLCCVIVMADYWGSSNVPIDTTSPGCTAVVPCMKTSGGSTAGVTNVGLANTTLPTYTAGQNVPLSVDLNGRAITAPGSAILYPNPIPTIAAGTFAPATANQYAVPLVSTEGNKTTCTATTPAAGVSAVGGANNDAFNVVGSATKNVRIVKVIISGVAAANGDTDIQLVRKSTANTCTGACATGTTIVTPGTTDSNVALSCTATANTFNAAITTGGTISDIASDFLQFFPISTTPALEIPTVITFTNTNEQAMVLRGTASSLAVIPGAAVSALHVTVVWTEEQGGF